MVYTGRRPLLDSLIAGGYIKLLMFFNAGSLHDFSPNKYVPTLSLSTGTAVLSRRDLSWSALGNNSSYLEFNDVVIGTGDITCMAFARNNVAISGVSQISNLFNNGKFILSYSNVDKILLTSDGATNLTTAAGTTTTGVNTVWSCTRTAAGAGEIFKNFVSIASGNTGAPTAGTNNMRLFRRGIHSAEYKVVIAKILSAAEQTTLHDELVNQTVYESNPMMLNSGYPTTPAVWKARFGLLAGELTMSAGQSLGQLDALKVVSGTVSCNTIAYNGQLAKVLTRVTGAPATVILPWPNSVGGTWHYKLFTGGAWTDTTSATATISIAAGEKVLWATQTGQDSCWLGA